MRFVVRAGGDPRRIGVFPGSFHPITNAHLALAEAALDHVDEVLFVMPEQFPHKQYEQVSLEKRLDMVRKATAASGFSLAVSSGGLFGEIAEECCLAYGENRELWFLCGRDAAERILTWDYGDAGFKERMLDRFGLLVAPRRGALETQGKWTSRIRQLSLRQPWDELSASEVRRRVLEGEEWKPLVPEAIWDEVARLYGR